MSHGSSSPLPADRSSPSPEQDSQKEEQPPAAAPLPPTTRSNRPSRACTIRAASRLYTSQPVIERKPKKRERRREVQEEEEDEEEEREESPPTQCSKIVTPLVEPPSESQLPRWNLRSMWELASVLNFLNVSFKDLIFSIWVVFFCTCFEKRLLFCLLQLFRPLLNISLELSAEEFETALLNPNDTLFYIHMPLLKVGAFSFVTLNVYGISCLFMNVASTLCKFSLFTTYC
jgi:hypothetical protein